jgi:hypothetical protein
VTITLSFLENNDKSLVLFAHHSEVLQALAGLLHRFEPLVVHGGTPLGQRTWAVNPDPQAATLDRPDKASGTTIMLTAAADVGFAEQDWVPSTMVQAAARCHRIGQRGTVMARVFYANGTLDRQIS